MTITERHLFTLSTLLVPAGWETYQLSRRWLTIHRPQIGAVTIDAWCRDEEWLW